jgi:hypothetical protein
MWLRKRGDENIFEGHMARKKKVTKVLVTISIDLELDSSPLFRSTNQHHQIQLATH